MTCNCGKVSDGAYDMEPENDYSEESSRLASFTNFFRGTCPVSVPALARAGFYYTGIEDRVECFSCKAVVEGWQHGDTAIGKHRKVSPNCKFINAFNSRSESIQTQAPISQNSGPHIINNCATHDLGQTSNSDIHDTDFLLRTGRVVDESEPKFPRYINMCTEEARLTTFKNWPSYVRVTPKELANAGLFYTGINDQVKCFCCGGKLMNWEPSDMAWNEHRKHFPDCFFVLGRDVGNIALESNSIFSGTRRGSEIPENPAMSQVKARLESLANWPYAVNKEMLARAGFYSTGERDSARCFYCGGELSDWKGKDDPWELHARWYPGCKFLIDEKGQHFINHVQLTRPLPSKLERDTLTALPEDPELVKDPLVIHAQQMGFGLEEIKKLMLKRIKNTGQNYTSVEVLVSDLLNSQSAMRSVKPSENENTIKEKLRQLEEEKICKVCMDKSVCIVFIPCGHLVTCADCGEALDKCPICCTIIERRQKIFMS
ncbi:E3 ubiquitin-protein ligase XIAP isoform X1 [Hyla sarda]|uniref:E3 ubiquitin-protein ligase XIAP isoform X1 n=1 Tax=Hyla sarda TaxID=327740 RepID=UPI0024C3B713|nr:E3 ubiquitin-protein ligase XIAP isoform X1 [Hyla sarda]XP_056393920.1 E3 ubiquitin-protein ligase XIAP isoform X1 [Hyla sarda]XP_056393921.1 E3 ubiquitin-protein ligase XIAP isoform X1 [Hyla sarda]XP_056393922.1 E3 ubiquitin-protein ligase XIAP isoform X1 [Hyla sarda]